MRKHPNQSIGPTVHIVDDDAAVRKALSLLVRSADMQAETYTSAREFLYRYRPNGPACLVLDIRMPEMDGLELQSVLRENADPIPIIMISGQGDIPMAVKAIKRGALDFIEKPFALGHMLDLVRLALDRDKQEHERSTNRHRLKQCIASLTPREQAVLAAIMQGKQSKTVASDLGISPRTVEAHRAHIMHKLGARTLSDLLRLTLPMEEHESETNPD